MQLYWKEHLDRLKDSLTAQTDRIKAGSKHTTIKGSSIEVILRKTLKQYLPSYFHIGTGQVANNRHDISPQIDVLIYDGNVFPCLAVNEDGSVVVCCESLISAIECKTKWDNKKVTEHYKKFMSVVAERHKYFNDPECSIGYFVFVIDKMLPPDSFFKNKNHSAGVYSIKDNISWSRLYGKEYKPRVMGNAFEIFLKDLMFECMRKGMLEVGDLTRTKEILDTYFNWS